MIITNTDRSLKPRTIFSFFINKLRNFRWANGLVIVILLVGGLAMSMPFLWMVSSSLKPELDIFQFPPTLIPKSIVWSNYVEALANPNYMPFLLYVKNSLFILIIREVAVLLSSSLCAYGFARIQFVGRNIWFGILLVTMMVPGAVMTIPLFVMFSRLHWIDTFLPLIIPWFFGGSAFNIFLLRQFMRSLPGELMDAARIDGCNELGIYWRIALPLSKPALITVAIFTFLGAWNEFYEPMLYLSSPQRYTVALGLARFSASFGLNQAGGHARWDLMMAASTAMLLPVLIVFFSLQRYFVKGIVLTGMKA